MDKTSSRPSAWWFSLVALPVLASALFTYRSCAGFVDHLDDMPRVAVQGGGEVTLPQGELVAYYEAEAGSDGGSFRCTVADAQSGEQVPLSNHSGSTTYELGDRKGRAVFDLTTPRAGRYRVECETSAAGGRLAFGRGMFWPIIRIILGIVSVFPGVGLTVFLVWWWRRRPRAVA